MFRRKQTGPALARTARVLAMALLRLMMPSCLVVSKSPIDQYSGKGG